MSKENCFKIKTFAEDKNLQKTKNKMKEYALIFRMDITTENVQPTPEQMETYMQDWMKWINDISTKGQLAEGGNHLSYIVGKVLRPDNIITDGVYEANKESVAGYIIVRADGINSATHIAQKCPILQGEGTSVEVRETETPQEMKDVKRNTN